MKPRTLALGFLIAAMAVIAALAASAREPAQTCTYCKGAGLVQCPKCGKEKCGEKHEVAFCSLVAQCKLCGGTKLVACKCKGKTKIDVASQRASIEKWMQSRAEPLNRFMGRPIAQSESKHFVIVWDVASVDEKGAENVHRTMHLFLDGLEDFAEHFEADLHCKSNDFSAKTVAMVWSRRDDQLKASLEYCNQSSDTECKLMGKAPVFTLFYDKGHMHEPSELHQALVHQASHCLLSNVFDGVWPGNIKGGWLDEGLAHWYEIALFDGVRHYCYVEQDTLVDFKFGKWEPSVKSACDAGKLPAAMSLMVLDTNSMTPEQHMYAWSVLDYVLKHYPNQVAAVVKAVKKKTPLAELVSHELGKSSLEFDADWHAWVSKNYSAKPKK